MRTDVKINEKQVICPNASLLGYSTCKCRVGYFLVYKETYTDGSYNTRLARMIGRIEKAPEKELIGHIVALALDDNGSHGYERWVDPKDVLEVYAPQHVSAFATWFFSGEKLPYGHNMLRKLSDYGTLSAHYIQHAEHHVAAWKSGISPAVYKQEVTQ